MTASTILQLCISAVCLIGFILMALARKDESCKPKCCANCKHRKIRNVRISCVKCIQSRELPNWEKSND